MIKNKKKPRLEAEIAVFVRKYGRKHYPGRDPNDRNYSRKVEKLIKQMKPKELDELMHGINDDE